MKYDFKNSNNRNPIGTNVFFWAVLLLGKIIFHEGNPFREDARSVILRTLVYINAGYRVCCNGNHQTVMTFFGLLTEKKEIFYRTLHAYKTENIYQFPYHWLLYTYFYLTAQDPDHFEQVQILTYPISWLPIFSTMTFNFFYRPCIEIYSG